MPLLIAQLDKNINRLKSFNNDMDRGWQRTPEFNKLMIEYHEKNARRPQMQMAEAKRGHMTRYTKELEGALKAAGICSRLEYTGSAYEGVKVNNDLEFDFMVILEGGRQLEVFTNVLLFCLYSFDCHSFLCRPMFPFHSF